MLRIDGGVPPWLTRLASALDRFEHETSSSVAPGAAAAAHSTSSVASPSSPMTAPGPLQFGWIWVNVAVPRPNVLRNVATSVVEKTSLC